ncbi:MAG: DNA gyrase/topoisomerase IV subunit A, partial [Christiangramia sp.]
DSKVLYFSANPNGEAEVVTVLLRQVGSIRKVKFDLDFADVLIKGRNVKGNIVTKYSVKRIEMKEEGVSTLKPRRIWFDETVRRLNVDDRGELLGEFKGEDRLLIITQDGVAKTIKPELTTRFDDEIIVLEKWSKDKPVSAIYWEAEKERYYVKRFLIEHPDREEKFISEHEDSFLEMVSTDYYPMAEIVYTKPKGKERRENEEVNLAEFIAVKGIKAQGNQLTSEKVNQINPLDPMPYEAPENENEEKTESDSEAKSEITGEDIKSGNFKEPEKSKNSDEQPSLFDE